MRKLGAAAFTLLVGALAMPLAASGQGGNPDIVIIDPSEPGGGGGGGGVEDPCPLRCFVIDTGDGLITVCEPDCYDPKG